MEKQSHLYALTAALVQATEPRQEWFETLIDFLLTLLTLKIVTANSLAHSQCLLSVLFVSSEVLQSAQP